MSSLFEIYSFISVNKFNSNKFRVNSILIIQSICFLAGIFKLQIKQIRG